MVTELNKTIIKNREVRSKMSEAEVKVSSQRPEVISARGHQPISQRSEVISQSVIGQR